MPQKPYTHQEFPKMVFHPEHGANIVATKPENVPPGWLDYHPKDPARAPALQSADDSEPTDEEKDSGAVGPVSRNEIIDELKRRAVTFNPRASTAALYALLSS
jgi:hypothetical protein